MRIAVMGSGGIGDISAASWGCGRGRDICRTRGASCRDPAGWSAREERCGDFHVRPRRPMMRPRSALSS